MRTRATLSGIFASAAILVVGWQAGAAVIHNQTASTSTAASGTTSSGTTSSGVTPSGSTASRPATTGTPTAPATTAKSGAFTGASESTRYGNVQVKVTVVSGKITDVTALQLTDQGGRSVQISNRAAPVLRSEVLASQSAKVASVGGATYTSDGYLSSVQSALDQAGL